MKKRNFIDVDECFEKIKAILDEYNCGFGMDEDGLMIFDKETMRFHRIPDELVEE